MTDFSFIANAHPTFIDSLYEQYTANPATVDEGWRLFFKGFDYGFNQNGAATNGIATGSNGTARTVPSEVDLDELRVLALIIGYRNRGHLKSTTNPLKPRKNRKPSLDLSDFSLTEASLDKFYVGGKEIGLEKSTLRQIIVQLEKVYCGTIGFEFQHIQDRDRRRWLRQRIEAQHPEHQWGLTLDEKKRILQKLNGATVFEQFLHKKFIGQKRFSLEGGETTIAALDAIITEAADAGVVEVVFGMAHRGRLNVLANILGKTYEQIFTEFEGEMPEDQSFGDGDVKYHLGFSSQVTTPHDKQIYLKLVPNPSHLEAVNPVVEGFARAKADVLYASEYDRILPVLIHGDAAVAGQGIVYECLQMSLLKGYETGGTLHFVINNQIGFTTNWEDARSSTYCTSVAATVQAPVFHVNGDDPEAVIYACKLAMEYRQEYNADVFIDMVCYRKHGHNEGDDPKFTQPLLYDLINAHANPREVYSKRLIERGDVQKELAERMEKDYWNQMQARLDNQKQHKLPYEYQESELAWKSLRKTTTPEDFDESPLTGIDKKTVDIILKHLHEYPKNFKPINKFSRILKGSKALWEADKLDWALGELLAYGSLLLEGNDVRLSGQDVKRGTFSHRHAVLHEEDTSQEYNRLDGLSENQGKFHIYNSLLSEYGVLGFEYGYTLARPDALVIWEAQFGDFFNGAQTMVDQFIMSAERKWQRMSGLCMYLPHGYEGQGPEHSSARLERFLQGCARNNVTVANVTTPANLFHLLRRQLIRPFRKPLVLMTPKSGLRNPEFVSELKEFHTGTRFQEVMDDPSANSAKVKTLLLCTGKIYYDLLDKQRTDKREDVAIVRLEQLYPLPEKQLDTIFKKYKNARIRWVQEEPANMGAWTYLLFQLNGKRSLELASREAAASPAVGFKKLHDMQQAEVVMKAFE
ncbi:MAG: 2-oxoglutarate dehydrogenase E1 component [Saprospiraceae bacterium]|nr:2-oxoglutarate dehydrogenase E1 component [Saprospiraceae bacterium]MCF8249966.1 2-oxoglutarate dehydrogenase E1 component [Saprospiraceae bacterium]MCF8310979.1 2-oxoglutarate dehydrogenase E1 component [Saprospiraceae bacterium]MCF8439685.1 2-oxoglutarate dehydrogenase E1 component [Saprospiraceae bacterium]